MDIAVELSLYPLERDRIPIIEACIDRLHAAAGVRVITNSLSTQLVGPYEQVLAALSREMHLTFGQVDKAVFVMKVIGPLADAGAVK